MTDKDNGYIFVVDTTVNQIMTTTVGCGDKCSEYNTYNMPESTTNVNMTEQFVINIPGGHSAKGLTVKDQVCTLESLVCVDNIEFFAIVEGNGDDKTWTYANVFGLAPRDTKKAPTYIDALKNIGAIKHRKATLFLNAESTIDLYKNKYSIMSFGSD